MKTSENHTTRQAANLRAVADILDAHPSLPVPTVFAYSTNGVDVMWQILRDDESTQRGTLNRIRRALGGEWVKDGLGETFTLEQKHGDLTLQIMAKRDVVCERRVTGIETVTLPAVEAQPERTETREIVEWDCAPILDAPIPLVPTGLDDRAAAEMHQ